MKLEKLAAKLRYQTEFPKVKPSSLKAIVAQFASDLSTVSTVQLTMPETAGAKKMHVIGAWNEWQAWALALPDPNAADPTAASAVPADMSCMGSISVHGLCRKSFKHFRNRIDCGDLGGTVSPTQERSS